MKKYKLFGLLISLLFGSVLFIAYFALGERQDAALFQETLNNNLIYTGVTNIVMTVYLNYRLFDTIFEAMLLLICVMGVLQFSELSPKENNYIEQYRTSHEKAGFSSLMIDSLRAVYPFVFCFGIYIIVSGITSPGGGFQGGAIIAAIVMSLHLSTGRSIITVDKAIILEKIMFILMIIIATLFLIFGKDLEPLYYKAYLIIINLIIGMKVFTGFVILYLQFMHGGGRYFNESLEDKE